jgi:L-arabinonolactonase
MRLAEVETWWQAESLVAECPRWHPDERRLYWVDIYRQTLYARCPRSGALESWLLPERIGCFGFIRGGGVVAGLQSGIYRIALEPDLALEPLALLEGRPSEVRFNDGRVGPCGRFWAGTNIESMDKRVNALYALDVDGRLERVVDGLICSNGLAFSPDGRTLYHSDSRLDVVWAWDYDPVGAVASNRRVFLDVDIQEGRPDGAAVDTDGGYWIAHVGGWHVARYTKDGVIDQVIGVPVQRPTMCAFGGDDLSTLYVTSARYPLSTAMLDKQPLAGSLFAIRTGYTGLAEPYFGEGPQPRSTAAHGS